MPIYEYECKDCGEHFEELMPVGAEDTPACPSCMSTNTEKQLSLFGSIGSGSSSSGSSCSRSGFS